MPFWRLDANLTQHSFERQFDNFLRFTNNIGIIIFTQKKGAGFSAVCEPFPDNSLQETDFSYLEYFPLLVIRFQIPIPDISLPDAPRSQFLQSFLQVFQDAFEEVVAVK
jgi:hypothetical protein